MNATAARKLSRQIANEPSVVITGQRREGSSYGIECQDKATGYSFVVWSEEDWTRRREDAEVDWSNLR